MIGNLPRANPDSGPLSCGSRASPSRLLPLVYDELRALAARYMRRERCGHTLQPTALVHEAYLRLVHGARVEVRDRTHFYALAASQMRRILVEYARARGARKRGGGARRVTLDDRNAVSPNGVLDMLALEEALEKLDERSPRQCRVVELRFFGGLSVAQTAQLLETSASTVKDDWRVAKAWLARELAQA
jgi:RNA polymerase sigma factor (TIGR02999 family)